MRRAFQVDSHLGHILGMWLGKSSNLSGPQYKILFSPIPPWLPKNLSPGLPAEVSLSKRLAEHHCSQGLPSPLWFTLFLICIQWSSAPCISASRILPSSLSSDLCLMFPTLMLLKWLFSFLSVHVSLKIVRFLKPKSHSCTFCYSVAISRHTGLFNPNKLYWFKFLKR